MNQIVCIKIAQRVLQYPQDGPKSPYTYFPYDRVYLAHKSEEPVIRKMLRYYLIMPLDRDLFVALTALDAKQLHHITVLRNDTAKEGSALSGASKLKELIPEFLDWLLVVPTHVQTMYEDTDKRKSAYASGLRYIMSNAVVVGHNKNVKMPPIRLVTPTKEIALLCGACAKLPDFYAGDCTPGQPTCLGKAQIRLKLDQQHRESLKKAIKETGGDQ